MKRVFRLILAVIAGLVVGSLVNMALVMLSGVLVADTQKYLWDEGGIEVENVEPAKEIA